MLDLLSPLKPVYPLEKITDIDEICMTSDFSKIIKTFL